MLTSLIWDSDRIQITPFAIPVQTDSDMKGLRMTKYQGFQFFELAKAECQCCHVVDRMNNPILEITFPPEGKVRSRRIVSRSRARATGKYPSWKMCRMMQWESVNELNAYRLLDANPAVTAYHEQPLTITFKINGEIHKHYPDTMVQWGNSRELWEIKTAADAARPEVADHRVPTRCKAAIHSSSVAR